ncbi:ATP synthase F1 subunit gamma [Candidatus Gottesmanbacteria bacterium]|nr:ATP synthase F1 subunit gamma [Candidatus Gottesmanbacteria bacterium]
MANIRLIKRRIKSADNISQITKAMEMVAASKMKKAQDLALLGKPYADKIYQAVQELGIHVDKKHHPLLSAGNPKGKLLVVLISTNKGLCGGLNTNLFRSVLNSWGKEKEIDYITVGKKGESLITRSGRSLVADFSQKTPFFESVPAVTQLLVDGFIKGIYREVHLAYNTFLTALKQIPTKKMLLPITAFEKMDIKQEVKFAEFLIEPSTHEILDDLLPHYLENQIRTAIFEAEACEHSARMIAMKNATDSALDFMQELTLLYNKARQEKITYEIADLVTARLAVE